MAVMDDYLLGVESVKSGRFVDLLVSSTLSQESLSGVAEGIEALLESMSVPPAPFDVSVLHIINANRASFVSGLLRKSPAISRKPANERAVADGRRKITPYLTGFLISEVVREQFIVRDGIPSDNESYAAFVSGRRGDSRPVLKESGSVECTALSRNEGERRYQFIDEKAFCAGRFLYLIGSYALPPDWVAAHFAELRHSQSWRAFQNIVEGRRSYSPPDVCAGELYPAKGGLLPQLKALSVVGSGLGVEARKIRAHVGLPKPFDYALSEKLSA